jgi:carbon-monoxide dehydrogenase small subunit
MTVGFILNGEDVVVRSEPNVRLVDILRVNFGLLGVKTGCLSGKCGFCTVLFNGNVSLACLIPAFKLSGNEIITIEGYSQTDEYHDILLGFSEAGMENCGFCNSSKILATEALLSRNKQPSRSEILAAFNGIKCRCTEPEELIKGVLKVLGHRRRRVYG